MVLRSCFLLDFAGQASLVAQKRKVIKINTKIKKGNIL
jgi:hypothetical protein